MSTSEIKEYERLIGLYNTRRKYLLEGNEELELVKLINKMQKEEVEHNCICLHEGKSWSQLFSLYKEHFTNKINDLETELSQLKKGVRL